MTVDVTLSDGKVADFAHEVKACALGQAASSIMARNIVGSTPQELRALRETVRKMLKENGAPPDGKWEEIAILEPVRDFKSRHASTLLTFDAVVDAIGQIEKRQGWGRGAPAPLVRRRALTGAIAAEPVTAPSASARVDASGLVLYVSGIEGRRRASL